MGLNRCHLGKIKASRGIAIHNSTGNNPRTHQLTAVQQKQPKPESGEITLAATEDEPPALWQKILCGGGLMERHRLRSCYVRGFHSMMWDSRQWLIPYTG